MNPVFTFLLIIAIVITSSVFGGFYFRDFLVDRESEKSINNLVIGILLIIGGMICSIGIYLISTP